MIQKTRYKAKGSKRKEKIDKYLAQPFFLTTVDYPMNFSGPAVNDWGRES
jgi:hypothetical protein